jgi:hypothetical protein
MYDEFIEKSAQKAKKIVLGDPLDEYPITN